MNDFADQSLPCHKLDQLNACHLYLQETTLAEITDHIGKELLPQAFLMPASISQKGLSNINIPTLQWPNVTLPSTICWCTWSTMIQTLHTGLRNEICLQQPLGDQLPTYDTHCFWNWCMYDPTHLPFQQHSSGCCIPLHCSSNPTETYHDGILSSHSFILIV